MDLVVRRDGYVEGVGTWIGEDRNHSFVRLLAAHKANGNDVALITPTTVYAIIFAYSYFRGFGQVR